MQVVITGAGVAGLTAALALARQGHRVQLLDRDAAPRPDAVDGAADWERRGVAQFHQPHSLLARLYAELSAALPDVVAELTAQGARPVTLPDGLASLWCRRSTLEWVLRAAVEAEPAVDLRHAASARSRRGGAVTGVRLDDGAVLPAGLVVDATGRRGRLSRPWAGDTVDVPADEAYVSRRYPLLPGAGFGTVNRGVIPVAEGDGYACWSSRTTPARSPSASPACPTTADWPGCTSRPPARRRGRCRWPRSGPTPSGPPPSRRSWS